MHIFFILSTLYGIKKKKKNMKIKKIDKLTTKTKGYRCHNPKEFS